MKQPEVSFIIPVYNMAATLPDALGPLLKIKGPKRFEIVIINDGSTDGVEDLAKRFLSKLERQDGISLKIISVDNAGRGAARNLGIKEANGKFICFLDADDSIVPDEFDRLWMCAENTPDSKEIIVGQFEIVGEENQLYAKRLLPAHVDKKWLLRRIALSAYSPVHLNAMLIKRELFDRITQFDTTNINAEDKDVTIRLFKETNGIQACRSCHYRYHKHNIGRKKMIKKRLMWLWFRQKTIIKNYSGIIRPVSMVLQFHYDIGKLAYECILGYKGSPNDRV